MNQLLRIVLAGFGRYRKRRKNLTAALSVIFFLMFFFMTLFGVLDSNLRSYWVDHVVGGDHAVSKEESYVDIMKPVSPEHWFNEASFHDANRRLVGKAAPRLRVGVMAEAQDRSDNFNTMFILVGIDAPGEKALFDSIEVEEGSYFSGAPDEIILPAAIMNALGLSLGQTLVLAAPTQAGFLNMEAVRVVGVQKAAGTAFIFGNYQGFAPISLVKRLVDTELVSEMVLAQGAAGFPAGLGGPFRLSPALECFGMSRAVAMAYGFLRWMIVLFLGAFAFGILYQNVTLMNEERRGEIAVYLTYGASPAWVALIMYGELAVYTLYCAVLGGLLGLAALGSLTMAGIYPVDTVTEVLIGGDALNLWPGPLPWLGTFAILLSLVLASASLPIWKSIGNRDIVGMFRKDRG